MTSIREALRRRLQREPDRPASEYSYTIYWTKIVRNWDPAKRRLALEGTERALAAPGFVSNEFARRYAVPEIDGDSHPGASLVVLRRVLRAFERPSD